MMFNKDFYPTPTNLIEKMIFPFGLDKLSNQYILDPSAGKGDILDFISGQHKESFYRHSDYAHNLYACEIEPDLRAILKEKGYSIVADDFLKYIPRVQFTHIIMNPPFSDVENHLIHAWEILYDGELVCLVPTTLTDWRTSKQQIIRNLVDNYGSVEDVGQAFLDAERNTPVDVSIIRLTKKSTNPVSDIEFQPENEYGDKNYSDENKELALNGFVANEVARYNAALKAFDEYLKCRVVMERYATKEALEQVDSGDVGTRWNRFYSEMTSHGWNKLLNHPNFQKLMTKRAEEIVNKFRKNQLKVDFNMENIRAMLEELLSKEKELMDAVILDAFDNLTKYHRDNTAPVDNWQGNSEWAHNKAWRVNKKVIVPFLCGTDYRQTYISINWNYTREMDDIDRALAIISGKSFDDVVTIHSALRNEINRTHGNVSSQCVSTFFDIKYYKRGTIHLKFVDENLLKNFNFRAAKARNWLPPEDTSNV